MHRVSAIWSLAGLALVACGSVPDSPEHVWLQRGTVLAAEELEVDEHVTVRWSHFVGSDKGWYSWGYVRDSSGNFLDSITGNTKATGVFAWQVPARLCGKKIQVEMCSGSPPRKTKHACHRSKGFLVRGDCSEDSSTRSVEGIEGTTATTTLSDVRELGPLPLHSRSRRWTPASASSQTTVTNTERPSDASVTSVALVVVWLGRLPTFAGAFAETARGSGPTFLIFHTHDEEPPVRSDRVHFEHLTLKSLATRLWKTDVMQNVFSTMSFESFEDRVAECYADDNPAKGNDLKPLYGALFQEELRNYTHWGWTDLDMIWGRLDLFLTKDLLTKYDVISFPDGARPALYLSGQLTIFQNTPIWRHFVDGCLEGPGHVNYGGCYAEGLLSEANLFFDEKLAIWFAALRHARIWVDFSPLLIEPRWSRLSGRGVQKLFREQGRLLVHGSQSLPFVDVERRNMEVHKLQNSSDCYTEFGLGWSFACVPTEGNDAFGIAYEIADQRLLLSPSLPRLVDSGVEFAAWHLHRSKQRFHWESQCQTVTCHRERSANISCECSSTGSGASWNLPIPNIVHFVLTDRDTRFFDWPCYAAIRSAWEKLQPEQLLVHVLDGVEPGTFDDWWQAARAFITAVVPFSRSTVPSSLNGLRLSHPAFIADFRRIQILHDWGGIYMDTDALSLREFEDLRGWRAVLARQGGVELRATVGLMMFEKHSPLLLPLLDRMRKAYTGSWGVHAGHVLDDMLAGIRPEGVAILAHSSGFFASSWHASDFVELMEESGIVDWSRCWSLHLYNSQTKRFTKDPVELCRDSSYKSGDLCNGLRLTVDMDDIYGMVGRGYPVMNSRIEEAFLKRADEQAALFDVPVSHSLDIQREAAQASRPEL